MERILFKILKRNAVLGSNSIVLDAGCGSGGNLEAYNAWFKPQFTVGLEYSNDALNFAGKRKLPFLLQGSTITLPFKDDIFDLVTSIDVLVQLPHEDDPTKAAYEMLRTLKPGGLLVVRAAAFNWLRSKHDEALNSYRRYTLKELIQVFDYPELQLVQASYANCFLFPIAIFHRLISKFRRTKTSDVKPPSAAFRPLNRLFTLILFFEATLIDLGIRLPFGLSVICVFRKVELP